MSDHHKQHPPALELRRNAEVAQFLNIVGLSEEERSREPLRYSEISKYVPEDPYGEFPFHATNATVLAALVQLGVTRLGVARAIISIINTDTQYILAEAVPLWIIDSSGAEQTRSIHVGCGNLPRKDGFCELVLDPSNMPPDGILTSSGCVILTNLRSTRRTAEKKFLEHNGAYQFYAGAPIKSGTGLIIGAYCVFCLQHKEGFTKEEQTILEELSIAATNQLETLHAQFGAQRRSKLVSGLHLFNDGFVVPGDLSFWSSSGIEVQEQRWKTRRKRTSRLVSFERESESGVFSRQPSKESTSQPGDEVGLSENSDSAQDADDRERQWRRSFASGTIGMFSRAASILRSVTEYDGTAFFYMSGNQTTPGTDHDQTKNVTRIVRSVSQNSSEQDDPCRILGGSTMPGSTSSLESIARYFTSKDLRRIVGLQPQSKTISMIWSKHSSSFTVNEESREVGSGQEDAPAASITYQSHKNHDVPHETQARLSIDPRITALLKLDPNARHFIALPLWDHERQRFFATCICWTAELKAETDLKEDLQYLRTFGNSVMVSLSRLDADATMRKKESFVASISHELRSPLHGILGSLDILKDTELYGSQLSLFHAIASCSHTLLDTLDHVIDFAGINTTSSSQTDPDSGSALMTKRSVGRYEPIDIAELVEEVADALWLG